MKINLAPPVPCQWKGLFLQLKGDKALRSAEMWISSHVTHCHGYSVSNQWKTLLQYLSDVVIISESCSNIRQKRVFSTLSPWLQRNLLAVIYQHRAEVAMENLKRFTEEVEYRSDAELSWTGLLWKMLSAYVGSPQDKISSDCSNQRTLPSGDVKRDLKDVETSDPHVDEICFDISDETGQGEEKDMNVSGDFIVILDEEDEEEMVTSPCSKKAKLEDEGEVTAVCLDKELIEVGRELLEVLQSSGEDEKVVGEALEKLLRLPSEKVEGVCKASGLSNMAESNLSTLCGVLVKRADHVTFTSCVALISGLFGYKLMSLQQTASRQLQGLVISLASTFPLQLLDAITVPAFVQQLGAPHSEVLNHLCKEPLSKQHQAYLLGRLVAGDAPLTDSALSVVHAVLEVKPTLDEQLMTNVVNSLANSSDQFKNNLKFGKLLLSFINKYGSKWTRSQISTISQISGRHKTFLRARIESVLKKL